MPPARPHCCRTLAQVTALSFLLASAACRDVSEPSTASDEIAARNSAQLVARGLAIALTEESHRRNLHAALRNSPWIDHKLLLQTYLRTPAGAELAARAAAGVGLRETAFQEAVGELAPVDLYLPFREHRLAWRATDDLMVVATEDLDPAEVVAYAPGGIPMTLRKADGVPAVAVLAMHPAEPRIARALEAIRTTGDAIELEGDADEGIDARPRLALIMPCEGTLIICDEDPNYPPPPPPPPPAPGDYITYFLVSEDDGFLGGTMEMQFVSILGGLPVPYCGYNAVAYNGVHKNTAYRVNLLLTPAAQLINCFGKERRIQVWEMDGGDFSFNDNDHFGTRMNAANFGQPREIFYNSPMRFPVSIFVDHKAELTIVAK